METSLRQGGSYFQSIWSYVIGSTANNRISRDQLREELEAANKKLEALSSKLENQNMALKRSNEDLERMAYIISHDLKAPVRNIGSFMKLLTTRFSAGLGKEAVELMELSRTGSENLAKQIDDLVTYCRVDRNLPPVSKVDLDLMVQTIRIGLGMKVKDGNVNVIIESPLPVLKDVHSGLIQHILQHLMANGIKFNNNVNRELRLNFKHEGKFIKFMVSDNGIGIQPGVESKLFQVFRRLHTQEQFEGTGIGLAMCKKIVNFYGGNIWFESEVGKNTTFFFTLPASHLCEQQTVLSEGQISEVA